MKKQIVAVVCLMAALAVQAAYVALDTADIVFSSPGPDKYADGTVVADGECYALVYSETGKFAGLDRAGQPTQAGDAVILVAPVAKDGGCPTIVFRVDAADLKGKAADKFGVVLLDTRMGAEQKPVGVNAAGELVAVKAMQKLDAAVTVKTGAVPTTATVAQVADGANAVAGEWPADMPAPKITGIQLVGNNVQVTIQNTKAYADYTLKGGANVGDKAALATQQGNGEIILITPKKGNSGFYSVEAK